MATEIATKKDHNIASAGVGLRLNGPDIFDKSERLNAAALVNINRSADASDIRACRFNTDRFTFALEGIEIVNAGGYGTVNVR